MRLWCRLWQHSNLWCGCSHLNFILCCCCFWYKNLCFQLPFQMFQRGKTLFCNISNCVESFSVMTTWNKLINTLVFYNDIFLLFVGSLRSKSLQLDLPHAIECFSRPSLSPATTLSWPHLPLYRSLPLSLRVPGKRLPLDVVFSFPMDVPSQFHFLLFYVLTCYVSLLFLIGSLFFFSLAMWCPVWISSSSSNGPWNSFVAV